MKKFLLVILVILMGVGGTYYYLTLQMVGTAENFFSSIKENNLTKAEIYLSDKFKTNIKRQQLVQYLLQYHLNNYKSINWGYKRVIRLDKKGFIEGSIISLEDKPSKLVVEFEKERGEWKISGIKKVLTDIEKKQQKLIADYTQMARVNIHTLGKAINDENMTLFYQNISTLWQKETTVKDLNKTYGIFKQKGVNLLALDKVVPQLTTASVDNKGVLTLAGVYILKNNRVSFIQKYVAEKKIWKLAGLSIQIK
jgi:hypothetical protein